MNEDSETHNLFRYLAIVGDVLFILWMLWNGIDESFKATPMQAFSVFGLTILLLINIFLIFKRK